jgi:hypothetical protein
MSEQKDAARARKSERNRRAYAKSKAARDHVLLRLDPGGAADFDAASLAAGLSRAAFARMFLPTLLAASAPRLGAIEAARAASGESLARFLGRALDEAVERGAAPGDAPSATASEFDALFG